MDYKENHIIYTAQDISQYLAGKLTPSQMHAMEKAALDDPFLAEAMEGYEGMKQEDWENELAVLKNQSEQKEAKVIAMPQRPRNNNWWKIAAAVVLIGSTATISYLLLNKKDKHEIAKTTEKPAAPVTNPTVETPAKTDVVTSLSQDAAPAVKPATSSNSTSTNNTPAVGENSVASKLENIKLYDSNFVFTPNKQKINALAKANAVRSDDAVKDKNSAAVTPSAPSAVNNGYYYNSEKKAEESRLNAAAGLAIPQADKAKMLYNKNAVGDLKTEPQLNRSFIAQVVGADNTPLPFANISIKSENFGTYADAKGNFRLVSADSLLTVEVKAAGYQPRFYTLQSYVQQNKIVLAEEDATARYKTISANSTTAKARVSRRATLLKDSLVNVEPADGWDNYNTYVDNNIEIPDDILKRDIHGQVELSFDVQANGTITNIKVDKSLCDNCDELAKRLIEQGPQWKVKKGKKGKGKVTVQF